MKKLLIFLLFFVLFLFPTKTHAAENFTTNYNVTYTVSEDGKTRVDMRIGLTNTTSDYYASQYKIQLGFDDIENVRASDAGGSINPDVQKNSNGYTVGLVFHQFVVGKGKTLNFNLAFDTPNIAQKQGGVWGINIPGIANQKDFSVFNVAVKVPPSFGQPSYTKPKTTNSELSFTKEQLGKSGISLAFGDKQHYGFNLVYHLRNKNVFPVKTEIALPPTTNYQEVFIDTISPEPVNVRIDNDGNWLAEFHLLPSQRTDITVNGNAIVSMHPKPEPVSEKALAEYVKEKPYWQVSNAEIKKLAADLKTPAAIYQYVIDALTYDFSRVTSSKPRLGAVNVLQTPDSAVCLEFTDLFIAIARAAGIPAREVNGYAYTENSKQRPLSLVKDILHAWPEYYDRQKQTWIMVDPTWGNTTGGIDYFTMLDFDHFVFVRKGYESEYPIPAGGYKYEGDEDRKDVTVTFTEQAQTARHDISVLPNIKSAYQSGTFMKGSVGVRNIGNSLLGPQEIFITSPSLLPRKQVLTVSALPPFGMQDISFTFQKTPFLTKRSYPFTIQIAEKSIKQTVNVSPFLLSKEQILGGIGIVIFIPLLLIIAIKSRSILIFRRNR